MVLKEGHQGMVAPDMRLGVPIVYPAQAGTQVLPLHLSLEACSLRTCLFFFPAILPPHFKYGGLVVAYTIL